MERDPAPGAADRGDRSGAEVARRSPERPRGGYPAEQRGRQSMRATIPRRHAKSTADSALRPLLESVRKRNKNPDTTLIELAYEVARDAHRDQVRRSGDP